MEAASRRADLPPEIVSEVPGPRSRALAKRLAAVECREVTAQSAPLIFWESAAGANVWDVDHNRYVDLLAGFGVQALGYGDPEISATIRDQAERLPHALGDVYPAEAKVVFLEALSRALPFGLGRAILSSSGSDAVESAIKTAMIATGRADLIAFEGAYHGLGLGALDATHRAFFREPFRARLPSRTRFAPYGDAERARALARERAPAAILVEVVQGRGGVRVATPEFLRDLRAIADDCGALLVIDEVYTGVGRTGRFLACEHAGVEPDIVALGKALGAGLALSACVGTPRVMDRWPASQGEALHTSTHAGNPIACAVGTRVLERVAQDDLSARAARLGSRAQERLARETAGSAHVREVRGLGLMLGVELDTPERALDVVKRALERGFILIPEGARGEVVSLTPPLTISEAVLDGAIDALVEGLRA